MEPIVLIPELKIHLAGLNNMRNKLMHTPYDNNTQQQINRLDGMIRSLEYQIFLLEG